MQNAQMPTIPLIGSDIDDSLQSEFNTHGPTNQFIGPDMTEQQLRELHDNEEIERFLHLFSAYVTEVRLPGAPSSPRQPPQTQVLIDFEEKHNSDDSIPRPLHPPLNVDDLGPNQSLSEIIALQYLLPVLPPVRPEPPMFNLGRLRLTSQRVYLAIQPAYVPFFIRLANLATWKDKRTSLIYCTMFWIIWYQNLLLPCLCLRILYSLVRRRLFPYPTYEELREHRSEIGRANEFGDQIFSRFPASSFGIKEIWRIFKVFNQTTRTKANNSANEKTGDKEFAPSSSEDGFRTSSKREGAIIFDDTEDCQDAKDLKRTGLHILNELADLHERIKNIFIWRRPASSRTYGAVLFFAFVITLLLPAKYIAKLTYLLGGITFWHVIPIVAALPPAGRARLPPAFSDVPTDADYAMELITERVAAGLDVRPSMAQKNEHSSVNTTSARPGLKHNLNEPRRRSEDRERSVDWKKWGERAAIGKTWADDGKKMMYGHQNNNASWPPQNPSIPQDSVTIGKPSNLAENHTYPAQHTSAPGLITITPVAFLFTPLTSMNAKFDIPLNNMRGVKKAGLLKGLHIRYMDASDGGEGIEKEEKFLWVGARDELFARLVGSEGRRWLKV